MEESLHSMGKNPQVFLLCSKQQPYQAKDLASKFHTKMAWKIF
jgi:hypothetical protein